MKRNLTILALALVMTFTVAGCTKDKAPNVTPTPTPANTATPSTKPSETPIVPSETPMAPGETTLPSASPNGNAGSADMAARPGTTRTGTGMYNGGHYAADNYGSVHNSGSGMDRAGDVVKGAVDGVGDAVKGVGQGVKDLGNGIVNATH